MKVSPSYDCGKRIPSTALYDLPTPSTVNVFGFMLRWGPLGRSLAGDS